MIVSKIECREYDVSLRTPLVSANGNMSKRRGLILRAETDNGLVGYGEIAPLDGFSNETMAEVRSVIPGLLNGLIGFSVPHSIVGIQNELIRGCPKSVALPSVRFGIETLLADLGAQEAGVAMSKWLNPDASDRVPVNAVLSGAIDEVCQQAAGKLARGYRSFKLKVGVESRDDEVSKIENLREVLGGQASIRLDANRSLNYEQAVRLLCSVRRFDIEYIEEPLNRELFGQLADLHRECGVAIALDESLSDRTIGESTASPAERMLRFAEAGGVDVAVIKPSVFGGLSEIMQAVREVGNSGIKVVISSAIESGIAVMAALQLAAALDGLVLPCGLDTLELLSDSLINESLRLADGCLRVPRTTGLGVTIRDFNSNSLLSALT